MTDTLELNLIGRVMLVACRYGINGQSRLRVLARAIIEVVRHHHPDGMPSLMQLEPLLEAQLDQLDKALQRAAEMRERHSGDNSSDSPVPRRQVEHPPETAHEKHRRRHKPAAEPAAKPQAKSMEEKLKDERKPVQKLLTEDCVHAGLVNQKRAEKMVRSMLGKPPHEAELVIVEALRQVLHDQVRAAIRRYKGGGPWSSPKAQEDMRQDILTARSVKSVLLLARQIVKEQKVWEAEHGKGGMLGLFAGRKKIIG
jgi:hypothetical protein